MDISVRDWGFVLETTRWWRGTHHRRKDTLVVSRVAKVARTRVWLAGGMRSPISMHGLHCRYEDGSFSWFPRERRTVWQTRHIERRAMFVPAACSPQQAWNRIRYWRRSRGYDDAPLRLFGVPPTHLLERCPLLLRAKGKTASAVPAVQAIVLDGEIASFFFRRCMILGEPVSRLHMTYPDDEVPAHWLDNDIAGGVFLWLDGVAITAVN